MNDLKRCGVVVLFSMIMILTLLFEQWLCSNAPEWMRYAGRKSFGLGSSVAVCFLIVLAAEAFIGKVVFDRIK